jgi:hypothetical protein
MTKKIQLLDILIIFIEYLIILFISILLLYFTGEIIIATFVLISLSILMIKEVKL